MPEADRSPPTGDKLRVLLFIDGLGSGGAQRQFAHLATGLAARGHSVTVSVYNGQDHFADQIAAAGIDIVRIDKPSRFSLKPVFDLARLYRARSAQVIIAFLRSPAIKAELARLLVPGMAVIAAERSTYPDLPLPIGLRIVQSAHRLARFVTVNSSHQAQAMRREFPRLADRIVTIRNGVAIEPPSIASPRSRELRLLAISSLMPYKNSVRLAEALALLRDERGLRVHLSWLGETFESMPGYGAYSQTTERIRQLGLTDQWTWLGVTRDVVSVLGAHDALIHPSLYEGTSNAVCEAMASALPVLAGRVADHPQMLAETGAGLLFDPLDVRSIADAIAQFASTDERQRGEMGRRGQAVIERYYSFEQMVTAYEALAHATVAKQPMPREIIAQSDERFTLCAG